MRFFSDRWHNRMPLGIMFRRDMLLIGTGASLACFAVGIGSAMNDLPTWTTLVLMLLPMPYNLFIWQCVWNGASRFRLAAKFVVRAVASFWLMIVLVL